MKKRKIVILSILLALLLAAGVVAVKYWHYIEAFVYTIRFSDDEIQQKIEDANKNIEDALKDHSDVVLREPTPDEIKELESGKISEDELAEKIAVEGSTKVEDKPSSTPEEVPQGKPTEDYDSQIAAKVAKMYVLKSYYLGQLSNLEQKIIDDYNALPDNQKNFSGKKSIITKYISYVTDLETECDKKVNEVLNDLKGLLNKAGKDLSLVDKIKTAYNNEKTLKKAYYIETLNK